MLAIPLRREIFSPRGWSPSCGIALVLRGRRHRLARPTSAGRSRARSPSRTARPRCTTRSSAWSRPCSTTIRCSASGLNTFSVYYQFQTGRTDWGPHSFYVALIAETGLIGTVAFGLFLIWLFVRLAVLHRAPRALMRRAGDPDEARAGPLALRAARRRWSATLAANVFYLTMQFYYFYALVLVIVTAPVFFAPAAERVRARARVAPATAPVPTAT